MEESEKNNINSVAIKKLERRVNTNIEELRQKIEDIENSVNSLSRRIAIIAKVLGDKD